MIEFKKSLLNTLCEAASEAHPKEFFAMLGSTKRNKIVDEYVIIPANLGKGSVLVHLNLMPVDLNLVGSIHSHPGYSNSPSREDIRTFSKTGKIHMIIAYPYTIENCQAYDVNGQKIEWKIQD